MLFRSLDQSIAEDPSGMGYTLVVHTSGNPAAMSEPVRRQIYALDKNIAIYNEETMEEHVKSAYFLPRLAATLFGVFGGIGLMLAAIGLYGVMSYAVSRRTREIGIRMALGARTGNVARLIVRQGMVLALIAMVLGWPVAWMLSRFASSFLYGITPHDVVTFASCTAVSWSYCLDCVLAACPESGFRGSGAGVADGVEELGDGKAESVLVAGAWSVCAAEGRGV